MFLIILLYALIALTFTIAKISVSAAHPLFFIGVRMIIAGAALSTVFLLMRFRFAGSLFFRSRFPPRNRARGKSAVDTDDSQPKRIAAGQAAQDIITRRVTRRDVTRRDVFDFVQVTLFHIFLAFVPEFWALLYMPSVKVTVFYAMTPFVSVVLSYLLYREKITFWQLTGIIIAFLGIVPLLFSGNFACVRTLAGISFPEIALIVSVVSATYAWFVIKRLMHRRYSLLLINGISMLCGGVLSLIVWYGVNPAGISPVYAVRPFIFSLVGLILISNVIVYNLYGRLLKRYSINALTAAGFLSPLFGAFYGFVFLGECFFWYHAVATCGIALGLAVFFRRKNSVG